MTDPTAASAACAVHGCDQPAEFEFVWSERTAVAFGWEPEERRRVYCQRCFDSKVHRHPWESADEVRRLARA